MSMTVWETLETLAQIAEGSTTANSLPNIALIARRALAEQWKCKAQPTADPPQDCDWPFCGCDPGADKVLDAIAESGFVLVPNWAVTEVFDLAQTSVMRMPTRNPQRRMNIAAAFDAFRKAMP